jgi:hypothetical protein
VHVLPDPLCSAAGGLEHTEHTRLSCLPVAKEEQRHPRVDFPVLASCPYEVHALLAFLRGTSCGGAQRLGQPSHSSSVIEGISTKACRGSDTSKGFLENSSAWSLQRVPPPWLVLVSTTASSTGQIDTLRNSSAFSGINMASSNKTASPLIFVS